MLREKLEEWTSKSIGNNSSCAVRGPSEIHPRYVQVHVGVCLFLCVCERVYLHTTERGTYLATGTEDFVVTKLYCYLGAVVMWVSCWTQAASDWSPLAAPSWSKDPTDDPHWLMVRERQVAAEWWGGGEGCGGFNVRLDAYRGDSRSELRGQSAPINSAIWARRHSAPWFKGHTLLQFSLQTSGWFILRNAR